MNQSLIDGARSHVRDHFRWIDGDGDIWSMFQRGSSLKAVVDGLAAMAAIDRPDLIVGIESLGPAVALQLGSGFVAVRKDGAIFPGPVVRRQTEPDYRGNRRTLSIRRDHVMAGTRLVLVDDWVETGNQATAVSRLVDELGSEVVSVVTIVDETSEMVRHQLPRLRSLLRAGDLR